MFGVREGRSGAPNEFRLIFPPPGEGAGGSKNSLEPPTPSWGAHGLSLPQAVPEFNNGTPKTAVQKSLVIASILKVRGARVH